MALLAALAGEDYTNSASIDAHPDWALVGASAVNISSVTQSYLPTSYVGERWFYIFDGQPSSGTIRHTLVDSATPAAGQHREIEYSHAIIWPSASQTTTIQGGLYWSGGFLRLDRTTATGELLIEVSNAPASSTVSTGVIVAEDDIAYLTFRVIGEEGTAGTSNDGSAEVWINGQLVYSAYAADMSTLDSAFVQTGSGPDSELFFKNMTVLDAWSTAAGVAPKVYKVTDDGGFTETVEEVTLAYYITVPVPVITTESMFATSMRDTEKDMITQSMFATSMRDVASDITTQSMFATSMRDIAGDLTTQSMFVTTMEEIPHTIQNQFLASPCAGIV